MLQLAAVSLPAELNLQFLPKGFICTFVPEKCDYECNTG